ncbi:uncharacterized protein [Battus philenor]|uniref:uncharacterized protein n=1 Tax=Battus philenor TaxID=42288 RepID=UPI0035D052BB
MESPVRICLGAAIVVNLLLLTSTTVNGSPLPHETNQTIAKDEKTTKYSRLNTTWTAKNKPKTPDVALNELHPKDSTSEEHSEKNAKYKDRGRVKFLTQLKSSTESPLRRIKLSTEYSNKVEVTPTNEIIKPAQILESVETHNNDKVPPVEKNSAIFSTTSTKTVKDPEEKDSEESIDEEEEDDDDADDYDKYSSSKFHGDSYFTIPGFNDDDHYKDKKDNKVKDDFSTPSFDKFSSYFSRDTYTSKENENSGPYKSQSFFDFDTDLTTPKNDFFDQKFHDISSSIQKNLASMKAKSPPLNTTNSQKIFKENVGIEKLSNGVPNNKSTVIIKNTKEIRLLDNEQAGTANKELSDVHGTSIYYEMSVLSTETYNITHFDGDDCDNDGEHTKTTVATPSKVEDASLSSSHVLSEFYFPNTFSTSLPPIMVPTAIPNSFNIVIPTMDTRIPFSTQNNVKSSISPLKGVSSGFTRDRSYSKRLNLPGIKDSPNSVTQQTDLTLNPGQRPLTRKFHFTTPKIKPIWMAPRRNVTKAHKTAYPTTIYAEHFNIKDKFTTTMRPIIPQRTVLTTSPSDIDPVLQSDVSGVKKVVHSQIISDNTIPSLWKRGSMKYTTTSEPLAGGQTDVSEMEIPPTMTAWALASLRSPPPLSSTVVNGNGSAHKSIDENELQKVGEFVDKKETTTASTTTMTTTVGALSNYLISKNITEIDQNKLPWKPVTSTVDASDDKEPINKSERLPAESNISLQSSLKPSDTAQLPQKTAEMTEKIAINDEVKPSWIPAMVDMDTTTTEATEEREEGTIQPVDAKKSTGFESITKLPSDVTTPIDDATDTEHASVIPTTTDYEITTIRFSYIPTEAATETPSTNNDWQPSVPTRPKPMFDETPITTYRPKFITTTEMIEETTTVTVDTTPQLEISSQILENSSKSETVTQITTEETTPTTDIPTTVTPIESTTDCEETTITSTAATVFQTTTDAKETTVESVTTEITSTETQTDSRSEENSGSNEVISQDSTKSPTTIISTTTAATTSTTTAPPETTVLPTTTSQTATTTSARPFAKVVTTEKMEDTTAYTTEITTKSINELEDLTSYTDVTTESSSRVLTEEAGSGAAIAIAVSTIGVIALVLLVGLLLVVRRRGRRGVYAQRCTPVSLDAYSLDSVSVGHRKGNHRLRASKRSYGNPAYDDEVTSHPMQYAALANFALDTESMSAEFHEIPSVSVSPERVPPGCEDKNRYSNVLPLPETRVPLTRIGNDPTTEYINANYVTGPGNIRNYYILCQAPLANTVVDFWRMIWEQNSRVIVMLTEYMENGVEKCYEYLPPSEVSDNRRIFGEYQIVLKKREQRDKYAISTIQLINRNTRSWREITHLWYFWPAKGVPDDYDSVIDFISEMRSYMKISQTSKEYDEDDVEVIYGDQQRSSFNNLSKLRSDDSSSGNGVNVYSPAKAEELMRRTTNGTLGRMKAASEIDGVRACVCVCASGAGRSAALVALDTCARALAAGTVDVPRVVRELRSQRPHALANRHHYIFLYKVLSEYGNKLMGGGVDTI